MDNYTHAEVWLDIKTPGVDKATAYLRSRGVDTCDKLEEIPEGNHWSMDPAGSVMIAGKNNASYALD